jgi:hypothetical protein
MRAHSVAKTMVVRLVWVSRRSLELAGPAALGVVLALVMTWPLVVHLRSQIGKDLADPLFQSWQVAWIGHALLHQPLHLFQANIYWPLRDSLAFSDALVGYAPAALIAQQGPDTAIIVYNLLFLFAYALGFLGAYLLAHELGTGRAGAVAAGVAFAYAPWRLAQNGHLQVLSSGGIPLSLFLLVRGYRRQSPRLVFAGWLVATWQMTLGWTLGLQLGYLVGVLAAIAVVVWLLRRRPRLDRGLVLATAAGICIFGLLSFVQARPYLRVIHDHPEARRTPAIVEFFSPPLKGFVAAPADSFLWGDATAAVRKRLSWPAEETLFPGATIALLALLGVATSVYPRRLRLGLAVSVAVCAVFSLGLRVPAPEKYVMPYRFLYEFGPGWDGVRTPGRINTLTSLGLALLAGAGLCFAVRFVRGCIDQRRQRLRIAAALATAGALVGGMLLEGLGPLPHPNVPAVPRGLRLAASPRFDLPPDYIQYIYWSTAGFPKIVNGYGSFDPTSFQRLQEIATRFPDRRSVETLRALGVRTIVFHPDLAAGTPWQTVARRPIRALPLRKKLVGSVVVYELVSRRTHRNRSHRP